MPVTEGSGEQDRAGPQAADRGAEQRCSMGAGSTGAVPRRRPLKPHVIARAAAPPLLCPNPAGARLIYLTKHACNPPQTNLFTTPAAKLIADTLIMGPLYVVAFYAWGCALIDGSGVEGFKKKITQVGAAGRTGGPRGLQAGGWGPRDRSAGLQPAWW